ncbi:hypothetical protein RI367_002179 [Sorochytrium milnesiophthora]
MVRHRIRPSLLLLAVVAFLLLLLWREGRLERGSNNSHRQNVADQQALDETTTDRQDVTHRAPGDSAASAAADGLSGSGPLEAVGPHDSRSAVVPSAAPVVMLIAIPTSANKEEATYRQVIRSTWGAVLTANSKSPATHPLFKQVRLLFFIGTGGLSSSARTQLEEEQAQNDDLVLLDIDESYRDLSRKMVVIYSWIASQMPKRYPELKWILKTDTDVWINVRNILTFFDQYKPVRTFIGYRYLDNIRLLQGKWANPQYSSRYYPQYMAGAGYIVSADIVEWVQQQSAAGWLKIMPNEDALMGIWFAGMDVAWVHSPRFKPFIDPRFKERITHLPDWACHDDDVLLHHLSPAGIQEIHHYYTTCGGPCAKSCKKA